MDRVLSLRADQTLGEAAKLMTTNGVKGSSGGDGDRRGQGAVSHRQLLKFLLPNYLKRASGEYPAVSKRPPASPRSWILRPCWYER